MVYQFINKFPANARIIRVVNKNINHKTPNPLRSFFIANSQNKLATKILKK